MSDDDPTRRAAEEKLRESEERYLALAELSPDATLLIVDGHFAHANANAARLLGAENAEQLMRLSAFEIVEPEYHDTMRQRIRDVLQGGRSTQLNEYRLKRLDGSPVDVEAAASPVSWGGKRATQVVARDITERKKAEQELRASELRYRTLFESIDEGFCVIEMLFDAEGRPQDYRFLEVNPAFESQTGLRDAEGKRMREFAPNHERHWFEIYGRVATTGEPVRFTNQASELRGGVWFDANAFRLGGEDSRKVGILFKDITERKRAELEIRQLNNRLESLVTQRTQQLTQANQELESFNYSVSHDLRAPLRGLDGFAQALVEDYGEVLDETGRSYLERIRAGAQRMGALIDDLLRLSRLSRSKLKREELDLADLAREIVALLRCRDPERRVEVEIPTVLIAQGDAGLLRVALENLLENAWKFTSDQDLARIEVGSEERGPGRDTERGEQRGTQRDEEHATERVFFVRDDGAGFDPRYAEKLFVPFGRLHSADRFAGTGIGLAMVQRVVHLHGGSVWGEGRVGEGAAFFFTLPDGAEGR